MCLKCVCGTRSNIENFDIGFTSLAILQVHVQNFRCVMVLIFIA